MRVCILIGGAVGVYADPEGASQACAKISNLILAVVLIILAFAPTKLLAFYEHDELQLAVGDWILMIWCVIASLTVQVRKNHPLVSMGPNSLFLDVPREGGSTTAYDLIRTNVLS